MTAPQHQALHRAMWQRFAAAMAHAAPEAQEAGKAARIAARTAMPRVEATPPYVKGSTLHQHQLEVSGGGLWGLLGGQAGCFGTTAGGGAVVYSGLSLKWKAWQSLVLASLPALSGL